MHRYEIPEHPEIGYIERTGYPSWMQGEPDDFDEDRAYEERREQELFGDF